MKKYCYLVLFFIMICLISCDTSSEKNETAVKGEMDTITSEVTYTFTHALASNPFPDNIPTMDSLYARYGQNILLDKAPVENRHKKGKIDTIYTFQIENSLFEYYTTNGKELLKSMTIIDPGFDLKNNIHVGMTKSEFLGNFKKISDSSGIASTIEIVSGEGENILRFIFAEDRLKEIDYSPYLD